ncbi:MAG: tRNA (pseudouridine(54)-N(1))-methyltransferase TrmY [Nanoarchaeota archaeon]
MREFLLRALKARTDGNIDLENLPDAGRLDLVTRCISSALWIAKGLRNDTIIHVNLEGPKYPPKIISFYGEKLKGFYFDEKGIAKFIKHALEKGKDLKLNESLEVYPGIIVSKKSFEQLIKEKQDYQIIYLHNKGKDIREFKFKENVLFVFGDYIGMPWKTEIFLQRHNAERVSLGKIEYHASQCIVIVNNELDRRIYS